MYFFVCSKTLGDFFLLKTSDVQETKCFSEKGTYIIHLYNMVLLKAIYMPMVSDHIVDSFQHWLLLLWMLVQTSLGLCEELLQKKQP